jgi:hypothetical protein
MVRTPEIILDGVSYNINNFSQNVQSMIAVRERWEDDLTKERSAVLKTESAIRSLDEQLSRIVQEELIAKREAAEAAKTSVNSQSHPE